MCRRCGEKVITEKVKDGLSWANTVRNAWGNYITNNEAANYKARERADKCCNCEFKKENVLLKAIPDITFPCIAGTYCNKCGCPLSAKVRSTLDKNKNNKCPINKW